MVKQVARTLTLAITLLAVAPVALASPTGGDPEPMNVGVAQIILSLLGMA